MDGLVITLLSSAEREVRIHKLWGFTTAEVVSRRINIAILMARTLNRKLSYQAGQLCFCHKMD